MDARTAPRGTLTLQTIAMPADTNANGDIFGGWLMAQMDLASSVLARERARAGWRRWRSRHDLPPAGACRRRRLDHAEIVREGATSMVIDVEAWVRRQPDGERLKVTEARFVFVAVDEAGRKRPLPEREV